MAEDQKLTGVGPPTTDDHVAAGLRRILADRERELLALKGPCSAKTCRMHYAHSGPCDIQPEADGVTKIEVSDSPKMIRETLHVVVELPDE